MDENGQDSEALIPKHGGYRNLKSFQLAQLVFDITIRFCNYFISGRSRTHDQMVQAARSGVQNIAEGSQASGTSKKTELKLTNVARASLEELKLDFEDYLRQHHLPIWQFADPRRQELVKLRVATANEFIAWVCHKEKQGQGQLGEIAANGMLMLIGVACYLLEKQLTAQAEAFKREGGFTERLYRIRCNTRKKY